MRPYLIAAGVYYPEYPAAGLAGKIPVLLMMLVREISEQ
jgi:hypothetical protein